MKTLFIHPKDKTTDFCKIVYEKYKNQKDVTIINDTYISQTTIRNALQSNDRIVLLGHGTEYGLLDGSKLRYIITSEELQFLKNKPIICIWCNANIFAEKYDLHSFATGMFVSEIDEATDYCLPIDKKLIDESNELFCNVLSECVFDEPENILETIKGKYICKNNPIVDFNRDCMNF